MDFLSIQDAALFSGKSMQTIRRMVKSKKIQIKKQRTPQGFSYLVDRVSLEKFIDARKTLDEELGVGIGVVDKAVDTQTTQPTIHATTQPTTHHDTIETQTDKNREHRRLPNIDELSPIHDYSQWLNEARGFNATVQKLVEENRRDKENFFTLIKTFQDRVQVLEEHIKMLSAPKKKWWNVKIFG